MAGYGGVCAGTFSPESAFHLSKQEEGDGEENAEVENGGDEKDGDGVVDVQMVETGGEGGVDRSGDAREENEGVLDDGVADDEPCHDKGSGGDDQKAQENHVECQIDEVACPSKVDEGADREHCNPCRDVDEIGERLCEDGRTHDTARIEGEPCRHAEDAELIPRDEEPQKDRHCRSAHRQSRALRR